MGGTIGRQLAAPSRWVAPLAFLLSAAHGFAKASPLSASLHFHVDMQAEIGVTTASWLG